MKNRPPSALVLAIALALCACSGSPAASPSAAGSVLPTPTPRPTVSSVACPYPDGDECRGPLAAGGLYETRLFAPVFSHYVNEGWDNIVDNPTEYQLTRITSAGEPAQSGIYLFRNVAIQAATCEDRPEPGVGRTPAELAAYLHDHVGLTTTEPETVNVGGLDGVMIEIELAASWTQTCPYSEGEPNVPLFWGTDAESGLELSAGPGWQDRLYILAMPGGGNVLIDIGAFIDETDFDALLETAEPVVESITFDPDYY